MFAHYAGSWLPGNVQLCDRCTYWINSYQQVPLQEVLKD